jgi:serine kinase of HPr protein (carbohydrate metabolism regulator)
LSPSADTIHAGAVRVGRHGVLVLGAPGSGKSSLVLAFIEDARGDAILVADDRVVVHPDHGDAGHGLVARPPAALAGLIEVRGVGIVRRPWLPEAAIGLVVELRAPADCPRLPGEADRSVAIKGIALPRLVLPAGCHDAALRVRVALAAWLP